MQQYDKMILAILQGDDYHDAVHSLNEHGFYATVLNSSGGFLKKRSVTLMIGLESARLDEALAILKKHGCDIGSVRKPLPALIDSDLTVVDEASAMIDAAIAK